MLTKDKGALRPEDKLRRMSMSTSVVILANPNSKDIFAIPS